MSMKRTWFFGDGVICIYPNRIDQFDRSVVRITGEPVEPKQERIYRVELRGREYQVRKFTTYHSLPDAITEAERWAED